MVVADKQDNGNRSSKVVGLKVGGSNRKGQQLGHKDGRGKAPLPGHQGEVQGNCQPGVLARVDMGDYNRKNNSNHNHL